MSVCLALDVVLNEGVDVLDGLLDAMIYKTLHSRQIELGRAGLDESG